MMGPGNSQTENEREISKSASFQPWSINVRGLPDEDLVETDRWWSPHNPRIRAEKTFGEKTGSSWASTSTVSTGNMPLLYNVGPG